MASEHNKLGDTPDEMWRQALEEVNKESKRRKSTSHEDRSKDLELLAKILNVVKLQKDAMVDSLNQIRETVQADSEESDEGAAIGPDTLNDIRQAIQSLSDQIRDAGHSEQLQSIADRISDLAKRINEVAASKDQGTESAAPEAPTIDPGSITKPLLDAIGQLEAKLEPKGMSVDLSDIRQSIESLSVGKKDNYHAKQLKRVTDEIAALTKQVGELNAASSEASPAPIDPDSITKPLLDAIGQLEAKLEPKDMSVDLNDIRQAIQSLAVGKKDNSQAKQLKRVTDEIAVLSKQVGELNAASSDASPATIDPDSITKPLLDAIGQLESKLEPKDMSVDLNDIRQAIQSLSVGKKDNSHAKQLKRVTDEIAVLSKQVGELNAASSEASPAPIDPDSITKPLLDAIGQLETKIPPPNPRNNGAEYRQGQESIEAQLKQLQKAIDNRADANATADGVAAMRETLDRILGQVSSATDQPDRNIQAIEKKLDLLFESIAKSNEASANVLSKKLDRVIDAVGEMAAGQGNHQINEQIQSLRRQIVEIEASGGPQPALPLAHDQPLVMRGYRRHRPQSRWGYAAIVCAPLAIIWGIFWYLMGHADPGLVSPETDNNVESKWLSGGCLVLGFLGIGLSLIGLVDRRTRHHAALLGLVLNVIFLLIFWILNLG